MTRKVIVLCILIGIGVGGYLLFLRPQKAEITTDSLSERSKEFLEEQKGSSQSDLRFARLKKGTDEAGSFVGQRQEIGTCFSFVMPFRVHIARQDGICNWYFATEKPRGFITAYMLDANGVRTPEQIDGVSMRQKFSDKYSEERKTIHGVEYLLYHGKSEVYEVNAFALHNGKSLTLNLITSSPENFDGDLMAILESIEFNN